MLKIRFSFCLLSLFFFGRSFAQKKLEDKFNYKVTYELTYKLDSTNLEEQKKEAMILYLGDQLSVFSSRAKTLTNQFIVRANMGHTNREAVTDFLFITVKSRKTDRIYNTVELGKDLFYSEEERELFDWEIHQETRDMEGYKTQKATTTYAGRDYIAWFTPEVPVSEGPYKFNGLPGLILEIADTEEHWEFRLAALEKLSPAKKFRLNFRQYIPLEKEELQERFRTYQKDPMGYVFAQGMGQNISINPADKKELAKIFAERLERMNNPIELQ